MTEHLPDPLSTSELLALDRRYVWHPFTQMRDWVDGSPLVIARAEGNYLYDTDGNRYLDGVSSLWVTVHGHNHPAINAAVEAQLHELDHSTLLGLANVPSIRLAEQLAGVAPGDLSKVFYSDSGSTAVEIALKQAFQFWQQTGRPKKRRFVHLAESYHGDTLGAVGVGGISLFHEIFGPLLVDSYSVPTPHPYRHPTARSPEEARDASLAALAELLGAHGGEIAAMIVEPLVQGAGGMLVHPAGFLRGVAELCRQHDVLLIADEVATGFGRTGTMFACEQEGVVPDFLCVAKGITGGYLPLAATIATPDIYEGFLGARTDYKAFYHGHTYTGNPLACAAALASLDLFERDQVLVNMQPKIARFRGLLEDQLAGLGAVGDIRQRGFMVGVELVADRASKTPFPAERGAGARVCEAARRHGVVIRPLGDVVVLMPPLSITEAELGALVTAVRCAIEDELA